MRFGYIAIAAVLTVLAGCSSNRTGGYGGSSDAGATTGSGGAPPPQLSPSDLDFVAQAAFSGLAETQMAGTAQSQSANPAVQSFARQMATDHDQANAELGAIAKRNNVVVPSVPDNGRQHVAHLLATLSGTAFDQQYIAIQIAEHRMAVALFHTEASIGQNAELRAFAARYEPILSHHLAMAEQLAPQHVSTR